jgi:DNA-binding CsgD family transcriptional regulator
MSSLLYPEPRFLLSVLPDGAPEGIAILGLVLYLAASVALAVAAAAAMFLYGRRPTPVLRLVRYALWTVFVVLILYSARLLFAAYYRDQLVSANTVTVHLFYGTLLLLGTVLARVNRSVPDTRRIRHFAFMRLIGGYLYLIGWLAYIITTTNIFIRPLELGAILMLGSSFVELYLALKSTTDDPALRRLAHRLTALSLGLAGMHVATLLATYAELLPEWVNMVLLFPVYVILAAAYGITYLWDRIGMLTDAATSARSVPTRPSNQDAFANRIMNELDLSPREREVLEVVRAGKSNREIARELGISEKTVRNHVSSLYRKTETRNRVELVQVFELA